jgi:hypothetical protein
VSPGAETPWRIRSSTASRSSLLVGDEAFGDATSARRRRRRTRRRPRRARSGRRRFGFGGGGAQRAPAAAPGFALAPKSKMFW